MDLPGDEIRLGMIPQDIVSEDFPNLVGGERPRDGMLTLDYARLTCILWQQCKSLQQRVEALATHTKRPTKRSTKVNSDAL